MKRFSPQMLLLVMLALLWSGQANAATINIDGTFADWSGVARQIDGGGGDDVSSPEKADLTEYRVDASPTTLYLLMAWDNTSFTGGNASTAGITVKAANNIYYRVYTTAENNPGSVAPSTLSIVQCGNASCNSQTPKCADITGTSACTGVQLASGTTWTDPFASRPRAACTGPSCGLFDTAVELAIPWSTIGGAPQAGQYAFFQFNSYPSGPANAPKDDVPGSSNAGISCSVTNNGLACFPATPTAVDLVSFRTIAREQAIELVWETATEYNTLGFQLYRSRDGQRASAELIMPSPIAARGDGVVGASYTWSDAAVVPDQPYTYWLHEIETSGATNEYGPVTGQLRTTSASVYQSYLPSVGQ